MISLHPDIMISFWGWQVMQKTDLKSDRDKQVQVRLPASLHKQLKLALIQDDSSLADFFNEAAEAYLKNPEKYRKTVGNINGGKSNG